ncbi:TonB-dependent receptor [Limnobacter sp.]|uniref:TonB-dependent receptor n=1 Tax=Limnobacter sp. TaxID=2003368 RepID=UPI002586ED78|nr:TonB-dependent receptor [Limnobacter sp.]
MFSFHEPKRVRCGRTGFLMLATFSCTPVFAQSLPPVYVTAPTPYQKSLETPIADTVITREEIANSPYTTLSDVLRSLGGVNVRPALDGSRSGTIDLRGFGDTAQNNVVVVVDGIRLNENEQANPRFSTIPLSSIQSIEIIRGGSSVEYGDGGSGGVVRITTRKGAAGDKPAFDATASYGSFNTQELDLAFRQQLGAFSLGLNGSKASTNGYRANSEASYDQAGATLDFSQGDYKAGASVSFDGQNNRFPGSLSLSQAQQNPRSTNNPNDYGVFNRNAYTAYLAKQFGQSELGLSLNRREQVAVGVFGGFNVTRKIVQDQINPYTNFGFQALGSHKVRVGFEQQNWTIHESTIDTLPADQQSTALYALDDWTLNPQWRLNLGSRVARSEQTRGTLNHTYSLVANELGATYAWSTHTAFYTKLSRAYRLPNIDDNGFATSDFLKPQISREMDVGLRHTNPHGVSTARLFVMNLDDEILFDPTVGAFGSNTNLDKTRRRGAELSWKGNLDTHTLGSVSYQYLDSEFRVGQRAGGRLPLVPANQVTASLTRLWTDRFSSGAVLRAQSNQRPGGDISQKYSTSMIPGFALLDLDFGYRVKDVNWSFRIANLFDRNYYAYAFGNTGFYPEPGRAYYLTMKVSY